mmetsp:Transcript_59628/g.69676  ORF Transcript_59628/g.69676 Transcript_59628/m.69676 type:complete len:262 (-) Transcript_59628:774-1559(-)|eukprot:CAMPEP_0194372854 /NCGR_PEP_ID=MMETSP0174-20130528/21249_1 /TAXON_ID=216777 /ORGANISM="Proboscia alata, Strain PI-D3" /LENGTH=261 /DNA_ID=CAMNT_0039151593 /DNA_START=131 /DNA_END=913 /DNA_ORIENTATION=-
MASQDAPVGGSSVPPVESDSTNDGNEEIPSRPRTLWDRLVYGTSFASAGVCAGAAAIAGGGVAAVPVYAMSGTAIGVSAPLVTYNQTLLEKGETLRDIQNGLRQECNRMGGINDELSGNVDELENTVDALKVFEEQMLNIVGQQTGAVDKLVNLVTENRETIDEMKRVMKAQVLEDFMGAILRSDTDGSDKFDENELEILYIRMKLNENVVIDETALRESFDQASSDGVLTTEAAMEAVKDLLDNADTNGAVELNMGKKNW